MPSDETEFERALRSSADPEVDAQRKALERAEIELQASYRRCFFASDDGQIVLKDLRARFQERTSIGAECNPHRVLVNEGQRQIVLFILAMVEAGRSGGQPGTIELIEQSRR